MFRKTVEKSTKIFIIPLLFLCASLSMGAFAIEDNAEDAVKLNQNTEVKIEDSDKNQEKPISKITFEEALKKAHEHSYDLQIADFNVLISKQGVRGARSEYFPKLNFSAGTEYTKNFRDAKESTVMSIGDAFINPYTRYQSVLGINVGYNLFDFGVRGDNLKIAKKDVTLKELETKEKIQELDLTLLDIYTKILVSTKQIEKNKEILKCAEENQKYYERLYAAKEVSKTELNDANVKLKNAKAKIAELSSIRQESINWLSFYTGENYDIDNLKIADIKKASIDTLELQDYTKSITYRKYEEIIKKKELELKVVKKTNYPKLNVYSKYYLYGSDYNNFGKSFDIEPSNFSVGAFLNMPLFDGMKNNANIKKTTLELKQLCVERDKAMAQLMARIATMRSNIIFLDEQISENEGAIQEYSDKEKSIKKLASKKLATPIDENEAKIQTLTEKIELDKNVITQSAITRGLEILTEEKI